MNKRNLLLTVILSILMAELPDASADSPMKMRAAMRAATKAPEAVASKEAVRIANVQAKVERRLALFPTVSLAASANLRNRDFSLSTPVGTFPVGDRFFSNARLRISQPLFDPVRLFHSSEAAKHSAKAAHYSSQRTTEELAMRAAEQYLDNLVLQSLQKSNDAFVLTLRARLAEVQSMVLVERAIPSDALKVELALKQAILQRVTLAEQIEVGAYVLGHAVGSDEAVRADLGGIVQGLEVQAAAASPSRRPDVLALLSERKAAQKRLSGVRADLLPKVVLNGDLIYSDEGPQSEKRFAQGSISVVWVPFASGTRSLKKQAHRAEIAALSRQHEALLRASKTQERQAEATIRIAKEQLDVAESSIEQSKEVLRITRDRYASGRERISDVLEAEAAYRDSEAKQSIAKLELNRAYLRRRFARGTLLQLLL